MSFKCLLSTSKLMLLLVVINAVDSSALEAFDTNGGNDWWPINTTPSSKSLECGVGITPLVTDMNGTRDANEGEIAWQVSVQKKTSGKWAHSCGGVVVNKQFVLTSAQCVDGSSEAFFRSEAGIIDLPKGGWVRRRRESSNFIAGIPDISYPGQQTPGLQYSQRVVIHPQYDKSTLKNNLALITLAQPFDMNKANGKINSICLSGEDINPEDELFVSGWGAIANESDLRPKLQVIKADLTDCDQEEIDNNELCATQQIKSTPDGSQNCQGDFGGPLFWNNGTNSILVGIYSSGNGCSLENPAKFMKIQPYIKWIEENSKPNYS